MTSYHKITKKASSLSLSLLVNPVHLSSKSLRPRPRSSRGFTIVELLIVIVVIGILAAISIVAYNTVQEKARTAKIQQDISQLVKAITIARNNTGETLYGMTGNNYTAYTCTTKSAGTDLAALPQTDPCWTNYARSLNLVSEASGVDVRSIKDPWNRPYRLDENEGENNNCTRDAVSVFSVPLSLGGYTNMTYVPLSGNSGCAL